MNVLFHTSTAIGIIAIVGSVRSDTNTLFSKASVKKGIIAFGLGVFSHGVLDFIPHCYPINSKLDAIFSLIIMLVLFFISRKNARIIVVSSFLGCVFPDLIDLAPQIINNYLGTSFSTKGKFFPWHWDRFSGSIYSGKCFFSAFYQFITVSLTIIVCWKRKKTLANIFTKVKLMK